MQNQAKNSAFKHRFYNLFSDIFSGTVFKQAYRLGQRVIPHVGGWFADKSAIYNKKENTEKDFVKIKNLKTKTEFFSSSLLQQAYRLGQLAFPQVGGWFTKNSAIDNTKVRIKDTFVENRNLTTKTKIVSNSFLRQTFRFGQRVKSHVGGWFTKNSASKKAQADVKNSILDTPNVRSVGQYGRFLPICTKDTPHFWSDVYKLGIKNFIQGTRNVRSVLQYGRILPICAKDTTHFWSEVYKVGTQTRKAQADLVQGGRSMIEMLGVLAIIGVLSVGGIAGYSKAMMKVKINKTVNQMSQMVSNIHTLYKSQSSYEGLDEDLIKKAKLAPDEVFGTDKWGRTALLNPFEDEYWIWVTDKYNANDSKAFAISIDGLPDEACIELATLDWGTAIPEIIGIGIGYGNGMSGPTSGGYSYGSGMSQPTSYGPWNDQGPHAEKADLPMSVSSAASGCPSRMFFLFE